MFKMQTHMADTHICSRLW